MTDFPPLSATYLQLRTLRAVAALPAAGAWDAAPTEIATHGARWALFQLTYDEAVATVNGAFDFRIQGSIFAVAANVPTNMGEWGSSLVYAAGTVISGADVQSLVQAEYVTFRPITVAAETIVYGPINIVGLERLRVAGRESGDIANPGTLGIAVVLSA